MTDEARAPAPPAATTAAPRRATITALAVLAALVVGARLLRLPLADDAYISACYARTLATSGTWGMWPGHTVNAVTSPLNVLVLAAVGKVVGDFVLAAHVVAVLSMWTVFLAASAIGRRTMNSGALGFVALAALATNPLLLSCIGLEGPIEAALLVATTWALLAGRSRLCGALLGLLVLARMDTLLLAAIVLAVCRFHGVSRRTAALWFVAVTAPWFVFSWAQLGSLIPDTFFYKTNQDWGVSFAAGPALYFRAFPMAATASVLFALTAPAAFLSSPEIRRVAAILTAYAAASFVAYVALGPPPCNWYYLQQVVPIAFVGAIGLAVLARRYGGHLLACGVAPVAALVGTIVAQGGHDDETFVYTNWGTPARYADIGRELAAIVKPDEAIDLTGELGALAYYSERRLVDRFSDQARMNGVVADWLAKHGDRVVREPFATLVQWNFRRRGAVPQAEFRWRLTQTRLRPDQSPPADPGSPPTEPTSRTVREWETFTRWMPYARFVLTRVE